MSQTLRNLLLATGLVVGGFAIYTVAPGSDPTVVKTQALGEGFVARAAEAEFELTPAGLAWFADAGLVAPTYTRLQFAVAIGTGKEADGGDVVVIPALPLDKIQQVQNTAVTVTACAARPGVCPLYGADRPFKVVPHACAWRNPDAGLCTLVDGGDPGDFNTMQPGGFAGAGCQLKSCVEIAGVTSAP